MDLVGTKVLVLFLLGALRLACGLLPLAIMRRLRISAPRRNGKLEVFISYFLCFGGGVLMATSFIHIIPEVREAIDAARATGDSVLPAGSEFPWGELCVCVGFFLVYLLEESVHRAFDGARSRTPSKSVVVPAAEGAAAAAAAAAAGKIAPTTSQVHLLVSAFSVDKLGRETSAQVLPPVGGAEEGRVVVDHHHHHHHHHCRVHDVKTPPEGQSGELADVVSADGGHLRGLLVVVALSFHSVFEGLALGLQPTERDTWYLFAAVAVHTCALLTCVGLELATSGAPAARVALYVTVLALVSPAGVAAGIVATLRSPAGPRGLLVAVLQGLAGGTILYVTFFEVLERERRKTSIPGGGLAKMASVVCGFAVMTTLQAFGSHSHHHHGVEDHGHASNCTNSSLHYHDDVT